MSVTRSSGLQAFTEHMAQRLQVDVPILRAIREFDYGGDYQFAIVVDNLRDSIERGNILSEAMDEQPEIFDPEYRDAVRGGESDGDLEEAFDRLAKQQAEPE